jgi:tetratricopeptide (TPR) repeat protein
MSIPSFVCKLRKVVAPCVLLSLFWLGMLTLADVIYLTSGDVLIVEKAWIEGDQVKYRASTGIKNLPASEVRRIQEQKPDRSPPPSPRNYGIATEVPTPDSPQTLPVPLNLPPAADSKEVSVKVIERLTENLKGNPEDVKSRNELVAAMNSLGSLQYLGGDLAGARSSFQQALKIEPKNFAILVNCAVVQYRSGEYRDAEETLLSALQIDPGNQFARYLLGESYYAQDKTAMAINAWKETLQLGPHTGASTRLKKAEEELGVHQQLGLLHSAHFIMRYDREVSDYQLGQEILYALERSYRRLSSELVSQPPSTITVILYPNRTYFDITRAPQWSGGLYDGKIRLPIKGLTSVNSEIEAVLVHELTHSFIDAQAHNQCPSWLNEGIAQYMEGKTAGVYNRTLAQLQKRKELPSLAELDQSFSILPEGVVSAAYWQGLSAVEFLTARNGRQVLRNLLELLRGNYNLESAWQAATGQRLVDFEKSWKSSLPE